MIRDQEAKQNKTETNKKQQIHLFEEEIYFVQFNPPPCGEVPLTLLFFFLRKLSVRVLPTMVYLIQYKVGHVPTCKIAKILRSFHTQLSSTTFLPVRKLNIHNALAITHLPVLSNFSIQALS